VYGHHAARLAWPQLATTAADSKHQRSIQAVQNPSFEPPDLPNYAAFAITSIIKSVELPEIYNFALGSIAKFATVFKLQSSKVVHFETKHG
jgi:hypothetical protein